MPIEDDLKKINNTHEMLRFVSSLKAAPIGKSGGRRFVKMDGADLTDKGVSIQDIIRRTSELTKDRSFIPKELLILINQLDREGDEELKKVGDWSWRRFATGVSRAFGNVGFDKKATMQTLFDKAIAVKGGLGGEERYIDFEDINIAIKLGKIQKQKLDEDIAPATYERLFAVFVKLRQCSPELAKPIFEELHKTFLPTGLIEAEEAYHAYLYEKDSSKKFSHLMTTFEKYDQVIGATPKDSVLSNLMRRRLSVGYRQHYSVIPILIKYLDPQDVRPKFDVRSFREWLEADLKCFHQKHQNPALLKAEVDRIAMEVDDRVLAYEMISDILGKPQNSEINKILHLVFTEGMEDDVDPNPRKAEKYKPDV